MAEQSATTQETLFTMHEMSQEEKLREQRLASLLYHGDMNSARAAGYKEGYEKSYKKGFQEGLQRISALTERLIRDNRIDDLSRACEDPVFRNQLLEEFGL